MRNRVGARISFSPATNPNPPKVNSTASRPSASTPRLPSHSANLHRIRHSMAIRGRQCRYLAKGKGDGRRRLFCSCTCSCATSSSSPEVEEQPDGFCKFDESAIFMKKKEREKIKCADADKAT